MLAGLIAVAAGFAGSAISGRSVTSIVTPADAKVLTKWAGDELSRREGAARRVTEGALSSPIPARVPARVGFHCAGCGVVESVRRTDRWENASGACSAADFDRFGMTGNAHDGGEYGEESTFSHTVDGVPAGRRGAMGLKLTSSYRIVVRFDDRSRREFNESVARALQPDEHVRVISDIT